MNIKVRDFLIYNSTVDAISGDNEKAVINTINAHSYIVAKKDNLFKKALVSSDYLLPDGEGVVLLARAIENRKIKKIAGADIHDELLRVAQQKGLKCFYLGSSNTTLKLIKKNVEKNYKNVTFGYYSPPFKGKFSEEDSGVMIKQVNDFAPDFLFIGMTAPKQEKWIYEYKELINANKICCIGAVFDFVAGTKKRAPKWVRNMKLEWFYRSFTELRLAKRYAYSTPLFLMEVLKLKFFKK